MKALKVSTGVIVIAWMCGAMFALWLAWSAKGAAQTALAVDAHPWNAFLINVPWALTWLAIALVLGILAFIAVWLAKRWQWIAYVYPVVVVGLMALAFWVLVILAFNSVLTGPI